MDFPCCWVYPLTAEGSFPLNTISDFIIIEPTKVLETIRGNFQVWEYRQTDAKLLGIDLDASYVFAKNFLFNHQLSVV